MLARTAYQQETTGRSRKKCKELLCNMHQKTYDEVRCMPI